MQVTVKTLRHYEQKELLIPNEVDEWTGYRYYSIGQMHQVRQSSLLKEQIFSKEVYSSRD
jgi:DNA-binding transcriptional MerR regulator